MWNPGQHNLLPIALATLRRNYPADGNLLHMRPGRTHPAQCNNPVFFVRQPQVDGRLVVVIHILIDAVLLYHKHIRANTQQLIELLRGELVKPLLMSNLFL